MKKLLLTLVWAFALAGQAQTNVYNVLDQSTASIVGGSINGTTIGATTPSTGAFTTVTANSYNKVAVTAPASSATLTIADGKTLTANRSLTLTGTDSTTMTFPGTSATIARTDAAQTFTGTQTFGTINTTTSLLMGGSAAQTVIISPTNQINGTGTDAFLGINRWVNSTAPAGLIMGKSRGASIGTAGLVSGGDDIAEIDFAASDGSSFPYVAQIKASVEGTPALNSMPGVLTFRTTASGGTTPTTRLTINSTGVAAFTGSVTSPTFATGASSLTLTTGAIGLSKMTASASAPGAGGAKLEVVCGTNAGTAKLIIYAGTSTTPVTIADNIGTGVTGC